MNYEGMTHAEATRELERLDARLERLADKGQSREAEAIELQKEIERLRDRLTKELD